MDQLAKLLWMRDRIGMSYLSIAHLHVVGRYSAGHDGIMWLPGYEARVERETRKLARALAVFRLRRIKMERLLTQ